MALLMSGTVQPMDGRCMIALVGVSVAGTSQRAHGAACDVDEFYGFLDRLIHPI